MEKSFKFDFNSLVNRPLHFLTISLLIPNHFFWKSVTLLIGFYSPAFASSPHSCLAAGFTRQSGLGGQDIAAIFGFYSKLQRKPGSLAQAFVNKRDGSGIPPM
ncbi:hypothetical protein [Pedobacter jeongneungensis]|uniref:hypothetical protein n=1 Tax=Pedobacter jeongneungensis TaxID=947309 RepID=UPI0031CEE66F